MSRAIMIKGLLLAFLITNSNVMNAQTANTSSFYALDKKAQYFSTIAALTALGNTSFLKPALNAGLDEGITINEIKEGIVQLYAYCGFPRSLNALQVFEAVLRERAKKGLKDQQGKTIIIENTTKDKYEQGRKVLEILTQSPQQKPAPGFGEFAPRIDIFLKEHLFADIFFSDVLSFRQREWITISALAAMQGVDAQLKAHINIGKNVGITDQELVELVSLIEEQVGREQANTLRSMIGQGIFSKISSNMIIRIAEIEIISEHLEDYKAILKEEASQSVKIEPGVVAIYPMFQKEEPTQVRIIEIYADKRAYESHLQTAHFRLYKSETMKMIKSLKLIDMNALDNEMMPLIFEKIKPIKMKHKDHSENQISLSPISNFPTGTENTRYAQYFTGKSWLAPLTTNPELHVPIANVTFEPGCRNNWHKHSGGQILIAVGGEGLYQERGKVARRIKPGDIVEIAPNVEHWHGATATQWFSHLAITCNPETNENTWQETVNDKDYIAANQS